MNDAARRYSRQILLAEIGEAGQQKLQQSKLLVVGAGGLGSASISYLVTAGIGTIGIVDNDHVELSNLNRQILHETGDIGRLKTESARSRVEELNPDVKVVLHSVRLYETNAISIISSYDMVLDGSDNFETRLLLNDECVKVRIPLISAAIKGFRGQIGIFTHDKGCYRCFMPDAPDEEERCERLGVIGALCGVMGSWQAVETIKLITGAGEPLTGRMMQIDLLSGNARTSRLTRDPNCPACTGV